MDLGKIEKKRHIVSEKDQRSLFININISKFKKIM